MIRRPPRSTLFPTRRSSDLITPKRMCKTNQARMIRSLTSIPHYNIMEDFSKESQVISPNEISLPQEDAPTKICSAQKTPLPLDFEPAPYTVIVGRGREPKENIGNKRLRVLATSFLSQYSNATDKRTKSQIVSKIVSMVRAAPGDRKSTRLNSVTQ